MSIHEGTLKILMGRHRCDQSPGPAPPYTDVLFKQVVLALHYLHEEGIIHKDVKPDNILYDHKGANSQLAFYLTDFGLSKEQDFESAGECVVGSIPYMAPEVYQSQPHTGKSDMWSLGVMMLEVLGYFCMQEIDLEPREWRNRMSLLPNFQPNFSFELYQGPPISNTTWPNHLRWYGRVLALPKNKMIIHDCLIPLLKDDANDRFDTGRVIARFPSENPVRRYNLRNLAARQEFRL
jgi:serine/threonine protein kinase